MKAARAQTLHQPAPPSRREGEVSPKAHQATLFARSRTHEPVGADDTKRVRHAKQDLMALRIDFLNCAVDPPAPPQGPTPANELLPDHGRALRLDALDRQIPETTVSRRIHQQLPYPVNRGVHRVGRTDVQGHACLLFVTPQGE